eukprot:m.331393 g.331393  ORF g.331393 m.331393 type:complete len:218 (-) comp16717_c0_seq1:153-806(-)
MGREGPSYGKSKNMLVSTAGKDHVIFSKKLLMIIGLILLMSLFIFFSVEQSLIAGNLAISRVAMAQNNKIRENNERLEQAKVDLQDEEDELVNMYSKWLDEDNEEIDMSTEELNELKSQLKNVQEALEDHSDYLKEKGESLDDKEKRLQNYQFKIQQKQKFLDEMAEILTKLNQTAPVTDIDADPEFIWDDEEISDDDYYVEYYTGDDDWMSDEEWY